MIEAGRYNAAAEILHQHFDSPGKGESLVENIQCAFEASQEEFTKALSELSPEALRDIAIAFTARVLAQQSDRARRSEKRQAKEQMIKNVIGYIQEHGVDKEARYLASRVADWAMEHHLQVDDATAGRIVEEALHVGSGEHETIPDALRAVLQEIQGQAIVKEPSVSARGAEYAVRDAERIRLSQAHQTIARQLIERVQGGETDLSRLRDYFIKTVVPALPQDFQSLGEEYWHTQFQEIRTLVDGGQTLEHAIKQQFQVYDFNIGNPGAFGFKPPAEAIRTFRDAVAEHTGYGDSFGEPEVRQAVAMYYTKRLRLRETISTNNIMMGSGASELIGFAMRSLELDRETAAASSPIYPLYTSVAGERGVHLKSLAMKEHEGKWILDTEQLERMMEPDIKFIIVNSPNNPTGAVFDETAMREIAAIAQKYGKIIISDDIYCDDVFEQETQQCTFAGACKDAGVPVISIGGISKGQGEAAGWRVGWAVFLDDSKGRAKHLWEDMQQFALARLSTNVPAQYAALPLLEMLAEKGDARRNNRIKKYMARMHARINRQRDVAYEELNKSPLSCAESEGAYYAFFKIDGVRSAAEEKEFAKQLLLRHRVHIVPGSGFGYSEETGGKPGYFRLVYLAEGSMLREGIGRIRTFARGEWKSLNNDNEQLRHHL